MKEKTEECQSCKNKGLNRNQWYLVLLSFYMLGTTVYGTIELIKYIISLF